MSYTIICSKTGWNKWEEVGESSSWTGAWIIFKELKEKYPNNTYHII